MKNKNEKKKNCEINPRDFETAAKGRHLNVNQILKAYFQGSRDHENKQKNRKRFLTQKK